MQQYLHMHQFTILKCLVIVVCLHVQVWAQPLSENYYQQYTTSNGLSHNTVTGIVQDSTGYVWLATSNGLNRFNGKDFVQYHSSNDSLSMASETLKGITWLRKNILGVYSSGLHIIDTRTNKSSNLFIPYHSLQYQYKFNMIERAKGDEEGNIYLLSRSGFYHFDSAHNLVSRFDYYSEAQVPITHFFYGRELIRIDDNRLVIVSVAGLYLYDKRIKKLKKMKPGDVPILDEYVDYPFNDLFVFLQTTPGEIFILKSTSDSMAYVNIRENKKIYSSLPFSPIKQALHYRSRILQVNDTLYYISGQASGFYKMNFNRKSGQAKVLNEKYFANYHCNTFLKDRDNHIWIGTNKGIFTQNDQKAHIRSAYIPGDIEKEFPNIRFNEIFIKGDHIYAGTRDMGNLLIYNKHDLTFNSYINFNSYRENYKRTLNLFAISPIDNNTLLMATDGPLFEYTISNKKLKPLFPNDWKMGDWSPEIFKDSREVSWISAYIVHQFDHKEKAFSYIPHEVQVTSQIEWPEVIREDNAGHIWMAGHGLSRYNRAEKKFDQRIDSFPFIKMPDKQVSTMEIDKKRNIIWFNSPDNGLLSYDIDRKKFGHFTSKDGLPDNNVTALIIVEDKLWIGGNSGISYMDLKTLTLTGFGKEDGFPDIPIQKRSNFFYDPSDGNLYISFENLLTRFKPQQLTRKKNPPKVFVESISFNQEYSSFLPPSEITTTWKKNETTITIGSINFSDASSQRYAYRILKNKDQSWIDLGTQPTFSISNLSNGRQVIQVKCYSATNRWPAQVKEITIDVVPPLWKKTWFLIAMSLLAAILIYLLIKWQKNIARKKEMVNTHMEKLKADDYKNQFELQQISNYFSTSLAGKKTIDEVLWDVAANLIGKMKYEDCIIYWWNSDKTKMIQKAAYGPKGKPDLIAENQFEVVPGQGIVGHVIQNRESVLVNDTRLDSRYRVDDRFRLSEICVPIIHDDELLGAIDSEHSQLHYFSERDIKILNTIATLIGNKIKQLESEYILEVKQKELAGINEQLAEARLTAMQAQMNPHFVFNALNSIKRMILDEDNDKASRYLSKFALMIRMTMEHSKDFLVSLQENINYLEAYLEMEKLRFDDSFSYNIEIDEELDASEIIFPSMIIQPLVENAIWHGLLQAKSAKKLNIVFRLQEDKIVCTIEDNGIGIEKSRQFNKEIRPLHRSMGLENLRKRLKILNEKYNMGCNMQIIDLYSTSEKRNGTSVIISCNTINI